MQELVRELKNIPLFDGMSPLEIEEQALALRGQRSTHSKGDVLLREGEKINRCGIVLEGRLQGQRIQEDGSLSVVSTLERGMLFGDVLMFSDRPSPVTLTAVTPCRVLWLGPFDLSHAAPKLTENLFRTIAKEYWVLHEKIRYCSILSLRKRIFTYLSDRQKTLGTEFTLPFDRNGMAAYLNADRSALSRELSRMKGEGILDYHKNRFVLKKANLHENADG